MVLLSVIIFSLRNFKLLSSSSFTIFVLQAANPASYEGTTISSDFAIYEIALYNLLFTVQAVLQNICKFAWR